MSSESRAAVLEVCNVSKSYALHRSNATRFMHQIFGSAPFVEPTLFPAIADISFTLRAGEAIAVLGRNGAGKSTLLQVVAGVLKPDRGEVRLPPRVIGLLELGSGFDPDFTGRENISINAAILGVGRAELNERIAEIIAFADIGDYIDRPVRTYSSGMFLRLAFGIATSVAPDLLLVDEVLAVGDVFFRQKCYERLNVLRKRGTAVVLVTHSISDAAEFCESGLVLSEGRVAFQGTAQDAVEYYVTHEASARTGTRSDTGSPRVSHSTSARPVQLGDWMRAPGTRDLRGMIQIGDPAHARIECLRITDGEDRPCSVFKQGDWLRGRVAFKIGSDLDTVFAGFLIRNDRNIAIHGKNGVNVADGALASVRADEIVEVAFETRLDVDCGEFTLDVALARMPEPMWHARSSTPAHALHEAISPLRRVSGAVSFTVVPKAAREPSTIPHYGLADLPGTLTIQAFAPDESRDADRSPAHLAEPSTP